MVIRESDLISLRSLCFLLFNFFFPSVTRQPPRSFSQPGYGLRDQHQMVIRDPFVPFASFCLISSFLL
jgi:hypothetical protein